MKNIELKTFDIPVLKGISQTTIEEHLKLYEGYVKNSNLILNKIEELKKDREKNNIEISELQRRFSFEWGGVRNHEVYFSSLEKSKVLVNKESSLYKKIEEDFGSFEEWFSYFKSLGMTRGVGWAMLCFDKKNNILLNAWVDEQHIGQLSDLQIILALDMWEHSYVFDYKPSGKKQYIEDFFENLNWGVIEKNFEDLY